MTTPTANNINRSTRRVQAVAAPVLPHGKSVSVINVSHGKGRKGSPSDPVQYDSLMAFALDIEKRRKIVRAHYAVTADEYNTQKDRGPWVMRAIDQATAFDPENNRWHRRIGSVTECDLLFLDADKMRMGSYTRVRKYLKASGIAFLMYPTTGHQLKIKGGADGECFRVFIACESIAAPNAAAVNEWLREQFAEMFPGGEWDPTATQPTRVMYLPPLGVRVDCSDGDAPALATAHLFEREGLTLVKASASGIERGEADAGPFSDFIDHLIAAYDGVLVQKPDGRVGVQMASPRDPSRYSTDPAPDKWAFWLPSGDYKMVTFSTMHGNGDSDLAHDTKPGHDVNKAVNAMAKECGDDEIAGLYAAAAQEAQVAAKAAEVVVGNLCEQYTDEEGLLTAWTPANADDGLCGDHRDKVRRMLAQVLIGRADDIWKIPPDVRAKYREMKNTRKLTGYDSLNTADNMRWLLWRCGFRAVRNVMTWEVAIFDEGDAPVTESAAGTHSLLTSEVSRKKLPKELISDHLNAVAEQNSYHPVARLLHGREWDGKKRAEAVFSCVPCTDPKFRDKLLRGLCIAAVEAAVKGAVSIKYAPTLFSEATDWHKTAFAKRLFNLTDGAFNEGASLDPAKKDSVRAAVLCWCAELGELETTTKSEAGLLKSFIGRAVDTWREEYTSYQTKRARRTVFIGTVNEREFIKDPTMASRFPVIELTAPVDIEKANRLLGWEFNGRDAELVDAEQLIQFWLEVREWWQAGEGYALDLNMLDAVKEVADSYTNKGEYYGMLRDYLAKAGGKVEPRTASDICLMVGAQTKDNRKIGKALATLVKEGLLEKRMRAGYALYDFPLAYPHK